MSGPLGPFERNLLGFSDSHMEQDACCCRVSALGHSTVYCTVLYCTVLYCTVLYCTVLYCTVLYCTILYCTILYCTLLCLPMSNKIDLQTSSSIGEFFNIISNLHTIVRSCIPCKIHEMIVWIQLFLHDLSLWICLLIQSQHL